MSSDISFHDSLSFEGAGGRWEASFPGLAGVLSVSAGGDAAVRSLGRGTGELDGALRACGMTPEPPLVLRNLKAGTSAGETPVGTFRVPSPGAGAGQVMLVIEGDGCVSWHFPSQTRSLGGAGVNTYEIPFHAAPASGNRGFLGDVMEKILKPVIYPLTDPLVGPVGEFFIEKWERLRHPYGLRLFRPEEHRQRSAAGLTAEDWRRLASGRSLLFIHGTFSTAHGTFGDLPAETMARLHEQYGHRVIAFNHFSMTHEPAENIRRFLEMVPADVTLDMDIVAHSRGGLVARALLAEIRRQQLGHRVRRVIHVAVPNQGTRLAHPDHMVEMLNRYTTLFHLIPSACGGDVIEALVNVVKVVAHGAYSGLKGVACMQPGSGLYNYLNVPGQDDGADFFAITANYEPQKRGLWSLVKKRAADEMIDGVFDEEPNDLVVPTRGVYEGNGSPAFPVVEHRLMQFDVKREAHHCNIFAQPETAWHLEKWLVEGEGRVEDAMVALRETVRERGAAGQDGRRVALVIGNGAYASSPLKNPPNDAMAFSESLKQLGFEAIMHLHLPHRKAMVQAVRDFREDLRAGDVGLFFFAGHGVQFEGRNYLIPVNADIRHEDEVPDEALDVDIALRAMQERGCRLSILLLDCCRDNPLPRRFRSGTRGLAQISVPRDAFLAFATAPGETAKDGAGSHSPFTGALLKWLPAAGLSIEAMIKRVMAEVSRDTRDEQRPWMQSNFHGEFSFVPQTGGEVAEDGRDVARPGLDAERRDWEDACIEGTTDALNAFVRRWPEGRYQVAAAGKLRELVDDDRAWSEASGANTVEAYRKFIETRPRSRRLEAAARRLKAAEIEAESRLLAGKVELRDWEAACRANTAEAYRRFIGQWSEGRYREEALEKLKVLHAEAERREWEEVCRSKSVDDLRGFTERWPGGQFAAAAIEKFKEWEAERRVREDEENRDWNEALRAQTADACRRFIERWPGGRHHEEARQKLKALLSEAERREWEEVCRSKSIEALRGFTERWPGGQFATAAMQKFKEWEVEKRTREEDEHREWNEACRTHTVDAYRRFTGRWPNSRHFSEALEKLKGLAEKDSSTKTGKSGPEDLESIFREVFEGGSSSKPKQPPPLQTAVEKAQQQAKPPPLSQPPGEMFRLEGHTGLVLDAAFSRDGRWIATGSADKTVRIWDAHSGRFQCQFSDPDAQVSSVAFTSDGRGVVWAGVTPQRSIVVRLCDISSANANDWAETKHWTLARDGEDKDFVIKAGFSPEARHVMVANCLAVNLWDVAAGQATLKLKLGWLDAGLVVQSIAFSSDGTLGATGQNNRAIQLWDLRTGGKLARMKGHQDTVWDVAFTHDGRHLLSAGGADKSARLWDVSTGAEVLQLKGHAAAVQCVACSPKSGWALTGSGHQEPAGGRQVEDGAMRLWDLATGRLIHSFGNFESLVRCVAFSPDGRRALSVSGHQIDTRKSFLQPHHWENVGCSVRVWNLPSGG